MIIKFIQQINESIKLPGKKHSTITVDDIATANTEYFKKLAKKEVIDGLNTFYNSLNFIDKYNLCLFCPCVKNYDRPISSPATQDYAWGDFSPAVLDDVVYDNELVNTDKPYVVTIALCTNPNNPCVYDEDAHILYLVGANTLQCITELNQALNDIIVNSEYVGKILIKIIPVNNFMTRKVLYFGTNDVETVTREIHKLASVPCNIAELYIMHIPRFNHVSGDVNVKKVIQTHSADIMQFIGRFANQFDDDIMLNIDIFNGRGTPISYECTKYLCCANHYAKFNYINITACDNKTYMSFVKDKSEIQKFLSIAKNPETFFIGLRRLCSMPSCAKYFEELFDEYKGSAVYLVTCLILYLISHINHPFSHYVHDTFSDEIWYKPFDSSIYLRKRDGTFVNINNIAEEIADKAEINGVNDIQKVSPDSIEILIQILQNANQ